MVEPGAEPVVGFAGQRRGPFDHDVGVTESPAAAPVPVLVGLVAQRFEEPADAGGGACQVGLPTARRGAAVRASWHCPLDSTPLWNEAPALTKAMR